MVLCLYIKVIEIGIYFFVKIILFSDETNVMCERKCSKFCYILLYFSLLYPCYVCNITGHYGHYNSNKLCHISELKLPAKNDTNKLKKTKCGAIKVWKLTLEMLKGCLNFNVGKCMNPVKSKNDIFKKLSID